MELFYVSLILTLFVLLVSLLSFHFLFDKNNSLKGTSPLPPGKTGWPIIGETLEFLASTCTGQSKFIFDRISKYSSPIFRTHILGESVVVFCGAKPTSFIFSNENKLVKPWLPTSMKKVLHGTQDSLDKRIKTTGNLFHNYFKGEVLQHYIGIMDQTAQSQFAEDWENKGEIVTYPLVKKYIFSSVCRLFFNSEDPDHVYKLFKLYDQLFTGVLSVPINLPGTEYNKGMKASKLMIKELVSIVKQRKIDLAIGNASPTQDVLSHIISTKEENELEIALLILGLLVAANSTTSNIITSVVYYLADFPEIYERVFKEQMEIANLKKPGELLNWDDVKKMKYSWNVVCEVLRIALPGEGLFREVITDFTYNGFLIPKGWKIFWSANSSLKNPEYFPEPKKFDPSRFEGSGPAPYTYTPFGGGPSMCPGKEFAKFEILVFMHNLVRRFKFEKIIPDEKFSMKPLYVPAKGVPIRLNPHKI